MTTIAILGSGHMGAAHARAYSSLPDVRIASIFSRSLSNAQALAEPLGAAACTDVYQALDDPRVEAVSITLPTHLHEEMAVAALQRGKHVLLEKPMALTAGSCDRILRAAEASGRVLMVAHVLRFWPEYLAIADLVHTQALGKPLAAAAVRLSARPAWADWFNHPEQSGGAVLDLHIHDIDLFGWLFGAPRSVYARGQRGPTGSWDQVVTQLDCGDVQAHAEASWLLPDSHPFTFGARVICERGMVVLDSSRSGEERLRVYPRGEAPRPLAFEPGSAHAAQTAYFVDCIRGGRKPERGDPRQARAAVAVCQAARQSLETGEPVHFDRDPFALFV